MLVMVEEAGAEAVTDDTQLSDDEAAALIALIEEAGAPGSRMRVGRPPFGFGLELPPDWKAIRNWMGGRSVLVTGAGGSIGSELCRQCARHGARRIGLLEIDELSLLTVEASLHRDFPDIECVPVLGDCGDPAVMRHALGLARPDAVFHAAAYKQVPLLQRQLRARCRRQPIWLRCLARRAPQTQCAWGRGAGCRGALERAQRRLAIHQPQTQAPDAFPGLRV